MEDIHIDASNKILGRLATTIAHLLRGKDLPQFAPNRFPERKVIVKNADKIKVTGDKMNQKEYAHYSGYPGGLKTLTLEQMFKRNPSRVIEKAVYGMLPKNKLRARMMRQLLISHGKND